MIRTADENVTRTLYYWQNTYATGLGLAQSHYSSHYGLFLNQIAQKGTFPLKIRSISFLPLRFKALQKAWMGVMAGATEIAAPAFDFPANKTILFS